MKHSIYITLTLVLLFFCSQVVGLTITSQYMQEDAVFLVEPPQVEQENLSFIPIIVAILVGTAIILLLAHYRLQYVWKLWFLLAIWVALSFAFFPLFSAMGGTVDSWLLAVFLLCTGALAYLKTSWRSNLYQNITELFIYGGIISIFFPMLNVFSVAVLLVLIAVYDMYAVWKSKHMVTLARFQTDSGLFAGISLGKHGGSSKQHSNKQVSKNTTSSQVAILGGGDIAFSLLFATVLLDNWDITFSMALIPIVTATAALTGLLLWSKPKRFYPAMPFIAAGCFIGAGIVFLLM